MTLTYSLTEEDYVQHLLFTASKSKTIQASQKKSWLILSFLFLAMTVLFYLAKNNTMTVACFVITAATFIFYPYYSKSYYRKHYQKFVTETYKENIYETATVVFNEKTIDSIDKTGEGKINKAQLKEIVETGDYFFVRVKRGGTLIIPKNKIKNAGRVKEELQQLTQELNIPYIMELHWKW